MVTLLEWSRMSAIHTYDSKPKVVKPFVKKFDVKTLKSGELESARVKPSADTRVWWVSLFMHPCELDGGKKSRFATTAYVVQLKS